MLASVGKPWEGIMAVMNVVHMRVKPGMEAEFIRIHREDMDASRLKGGRNFWLVRSGERSFIVVAEWDDAGALTAARPEMIANLDRLRPILEDLGGGRGVTEPWSGEVALHLPL
jgi:quinol monooxygenase YgiN